MEVSRLGRKALTAGVIFTTALWSMMAALAVPASVAAAGCTSGTLIKGPLPAVYYCGGDGKRYVFVNDKAFFTWYTDFSGVQTLSASELADIPLGGNVTYKPGKRMVKIQSDPTVYVISEGGVLHHVPSEQCAATLYGSNWNKQIDDIPDSFFVNYTVGTPLAACSDYHKSDEEDRSDSINHDRHIGPPGLTAIGVEEASPSDGATHVSLNARLAIRFTEPPLESSVNASTFTLTTGSASGTQVEGEVEVHGIDAYFYPSADLAQGTTYTATLTTGIMDHQGDHLQTPYIWTFTTGASITEAPTVLSVSPADRATSVASDTAVTARFSETIDASTIGAASFTLTKSGTSTPVAGTATGSGNMATFTPSAPLEADATYTATITSAVKSSDGVAMASSYDWSFTVAAPPAPTALISVTPFDGATFVATNTSITATFGGPMDSSSVEDGFTVRSASGTQIAGTIFMTNSTAVFRPSAPLDGATTYTATLSADVKDTLGQPLAGGAHSWSFTTRS